jgi:hypothetical protein
MGQEQGKPKDTASTEYAKEAARMHHVTTKEAVVATKLPYEVEADRLLEQLAGLKCRPPLLTTSVEGSILGKRDKFIEEISNHHTPIREHMLFNEDLVRLFAQYQTIEMREGTASMKRAEEIVARMSQTVFYSNVLRSSAAATAQRLHHTTDSLADVDAVLDAASNLHETIVDVSQLLIEINGMLSEEERHEVRVEVDHLMNDELVRSRSASISSVDSALR